MAANQKYHPLAKNEHSSDKDLDAHSQISDMELEDSADVSLLRGTIKAGRERRRSVIWNILSTLNFLALTGCLAILLQLYNRPAPASAGECVTPYAKLARDPSAKWPYNEGYGAEVTNHTLLDERWEAISINDGVVAIDKQWAHDNNLGESQPFPWDDSKGIYLITAFHQLHCVQTVHRLVYELHHDLPRTRSTEHALHCLDHLRTDAMCEADDFLLPSGPPRYMSKGPRGQARTCRNWDQLVAWARQRNACYQHISNDEERFGAEHSQYERFLNCPPDSPYFEAAKRFKEQNGF